mgnify:CR=1 FL=1
MVTDLKQKLRKKRRERLTNYSNTAYQKLADQQIIYFNKILQECHSLTIKIAKCGKTKLEDSYYLLLNDIKDELAKKDKTLLIYKDLLMLEKIKFRYIEFIKTKKGGENNG